MSKEGKSKKDKGKESSSLLRNIILLLLVLLPVVLVTGLLIAGRWALGQIRDQDRYAFTFADIDCTPPEYQDRASFLAEVQYLAAMPDRLQILDEDLTARLGEAFARHPWVEKVQKVQIVPPRQVQVQLTYRLPVLIVPQGEQTRVVDRHGILLPPAAPT